MHDALGVGRGERVGERDGDLEEPIDGEAALGRSAASGCPSTSSIVRKRMPSASSTE